MRTAGNSRAVREGSQGSSPPRHLLLPCGSLSHSFLYLPPPSFCSHRSCGKLHLERESCFLGMLLDERSQSNAQLTGSLPPFSICSFWFSMEQLQSSSQLRLGALSLISASHLLCIPQELSRGGNQVATMHGGSETKRIIGKKKSQGVHSRWLQVHIWSAH